MKILKTLFGCLAGAVLTMNVNAQQVQGFVHERSTDYEWPKDQKVLDKLDKWQDQKFGVSLGTIFCSRYCRVMVHLFRGRRLDLPQERYDLR